MHLGDVEQAVNRLAHPRRRRLATVDLRPDGRRQGILAVEPPPQHFEIEHQHRQRGFELMGRDRAEQIAKPQRFGAALELFLRRSFERRLGAQVGR